MTVDTSTQPDPAIVDEALAEVKEMMDQDGYRLAWKPESAESLSVTIEAGPEACADCLSPTPVMEAIVQKALSETFYTVREVILPSEH